MNNFFRCFVIICLLGVAFSNGVSAREKIFNAEHFTLENGLNVLVIPNHRAPVITQMVWYRVGAADEKPGESGLAHYLEHMMFKGSESVSPGEFSKRVKALGGQDNAFTGQDFTAYFQSVSLDGLEEVMKMESDRMRGLLLPPEEIKSERLVVIEERRQRTENDPRAYFGEQLTATLFMNHPYSNPIVGWLSEVDALNEDKLRGFYEKHYGPNNAWLIVSGDMTAEKFRPLAEKYYGDIPPLGVVPDRNWTKVPPFYAETHLTLHHKDIQQASIRKIYRVPGLRQNREASAALEVLENILDGGSATRLYQRLVVEKKVAVSVTASYYGTRWSDGIFTVSSIPADGVSLKELEEALDAELLDVIENGVTVKEVTEAKSRLKDYAIFARDSLRGPAMAFGQAVTTGGTIEDVEYWPYRIDSVAVEDIQKFAAEYLNPDMFGSRPPVVGYILPETEQTGQTP